MSLLGHSMRGDLGARLGTKLSGIEPDTVFYPASMREDSSKTIWSIAIAAVLVGAAYWLNGAKND